MQLLFFLQLFFSLYATIISVFMTFSLFSVYMQLPNDNEVFIDPFDSEPVEVAQGSNIVFICRGVAAGNSSVVLSWTDFNSPNRALPSREASPTNFTQSDVDQLCLDSSGVWTLSLQKDISPNTTLSSDGAHFLHLQVPLLVCSAEPSISDTYQCSATNTSREHQPVFLVIRVPGSSFVGVVAGATVVVIIIIIIAIFVILVCLCCRRAAKSPRPMVHQNLLPPSPAQRRNQHEFTNLTFQYPSISENASALEFSRDKLRFLNVLGGWTIIIGCLF